MAKRGAELRARGQKRARPTPKKRATRKPKPRPDIGQQAEVTTEQELVARSTAALDATLELEADLTDRLAALDAPLKSADNEAWSLEEYGGDLEDEPEPGPQGDREGEPDSDDETPGRRGVARPALSLLRFGKTLRPVVDEFLVRAPLRHQLLALVGEFLVERYESALSADDRASVQDAVTQQAQTVTQNMLVAFVARRWPGDGEAKAPDKSVISRALQGNMVRVPHLGIVPLGLFFGLDGRAWVAGPRAEPRAERLRLLRIWLEEDSDLEDKYLLQRLHSRGHKVSIHSLGRLRRDHLKMRKRRGPKQDHQPRVRKPRGS